MKKIFVLNYDRLTLICKFHQNEHQKSSNRKRIDNVWKPYVEMVGSGGGGRRRPNQRKLDDKSNHCVTHLRFFLLCKYKFICMHVFQRFPSLPFKKFFIIKIIIKTVLLLQTMNLDFMSCFST